MMEMRTLATGERLLREPHWSNRGHVYYTPGGPEGMVEVVNFGVVSHNLVLNAEAWELDDPALGYHALRLRFRKAADRRQKPKLNLGPK